MILNYCLSSSFSSLSINIFEIKKNYDANIKECKLSNANKTEEKGRKKYE